MKVILLKSVPKVGKKDDVVEVAEGYARNALFPSKAAIAATPDTLADLKRKKAGIVAEKALRHELLDIAIKSISGAAVTLAVKANNKGGMFSSIDEQDVVRALADDHRIMLDRSCIKLPHSPIKELGEYTVTVKDEDYSSTFTLQIIQK